MAVAAVCVLPLVVITLSALELGAGPAWALLWRPRIAELMGNTLSLVALTVATTSVIGIGAAWLVERTTLPGARFWRVLLVCPLAVPAFVNSYAWISLRPGLGPVTRHHNRRTNSPPDPSSEILMSISSSGIDGAGPAGPVRASASGSCGACDRCPCSGPGRSIANDTVAVVGQASVLVGVDAAGGRGAAVEDPSHRVVHGITGFAAAQELQVHVGRQPVGVDGAAGGRQALRDELPAV